VADLGAWLCFEDESGQGSRPPTGRTWERRGHTPVVSVTARNGPGLSLAADLCQAGLPAATEPVKNRLRRMQYRPGLIDGFLAKTGLDLAAS